MKQRNRTSYQKKTEVNKDDQQIQSDQTQQESQQQIKDNFNLKSNNQSFFISNYQGDIPLDKLSINQIEPYVKNINQQKCNQKSIEVQKDFQQNSKNFEKGSINYQSSNLQEQNQENNKKENISDTRNLRNSQFVHLKDKFEEEKKGRIDDITIENSSQSSSENDLTGTQRQERTDIIRMSAILNEQTLKQLQSKNASDKEDQADNNKVDNSNDEDENDTMNLQFKLVKEIAILNKLRRGGDQSPRSVVIPGDSIAADIKMGWRPKNPYSGAPIPLYYDYEVFQGIDYTSTDIHTMPFYLGPRIPNSIFVHKQFSKKDLKSNQQAYIFKFPPNPSQIFRKRTEDPRIFTGMNPNLKVQMSNQNYPEQELIFDSNFESGNLDIVQKPKDLEYNLYMRVDTNTRGHHQWFYFSVEHKDFFLNKRVTFNIVNFTKEEALYDTGMRVVISRKSDGFKQFKGGENIVYQQSKHIRKNNSDPMKVRYYFQLSFQYKFTSKEDKVFFSYSYPYTFTKLQLFLKEISFLKSNIPPQADQSTQITLQKPDHIKINLLCKSLSGVDVPIITITSRLNSDPLEYNLVKLEEFEDQDSMVTIPLYKKKKYIIITGRVHPGESNSSYMMQGFIKYLMGNSFQAKQLRKRVIFKIVPMINVDGVIIGNYRTSMAGNDLNRRYVDPDFRLHPEICAIKNLVSDLIYGEIASQWPNSTAEKGPEIIDEDILTFIDMHGHSRKKNVFIYGPQFPLSSEKYYSLRLIPKLLAEETSKFRFHSCQFKYEHTKRKTARIVLSQEFNITNCYTLEASFHGHFDDNRINYEFNEKSFEEMGEHLLNTLYEYVMIIEEELRIKQLREIERRKKKRQQQAANRNLSFKEPTLQSSKKNQQSLQKEENQNLKTDQNKNAQSINNSTKQESPMKLNKKKTIKQSLMNKLTDGQSSPVKSPDNQYIASPLKSIRKEKKNTNAFESDSKKLIFNEKNNLTSVKFKEPNSASGIQISCQLNESDSEDVESEVEDAFSDQEISLRKSQGKLEKQEQSLRQSQTNIKIEVSELDSQKGNTVGQGGRIRTLKDIFKQIQKDEDVRQEKEKIEEEELGFAPDKEDPEPDNKSDKSNKGGQDSDDSEGELCGKERQDLFQDIFSTLNEFSKQYGGNTIYNIQESLEQKRRREDAAKRRKKTIKFVDTQTHITKNILNTSQEGRKNLLEKQNKTARGKQKKMIENNQEQNHNFVFSSTTAGQGNAFSQIKAVVPSHKVYSKTYDLNQDKEQRLQNRQRLAHQGLLNRIGMRAQATKTIPVKSFLNTKYNQEIQNMLLEQAIPHAQFNHFQPQIGLSPIIANKIYTAQEQKQYLQSLAGFSAAANQYIEGNINVFNRNQVSQENEMERFFNPNYNIIHGEDGIYIGEGLFTVQAPQKKFRKDFSAAKNKQSLKFQHVIQSPQDNFVFNNPQINGMSSLPIIQGNQGSIIHRQLKIPRYIKAQSQDQRQNLINGQQIPQNIEIIQNQIINIQNLENFNCNINSAQDSLDRRGYPINIQQKFAQTNQQFFEQQSHSLKNDKYDEMKYIYENMHRGGIMLGPKQSMMNYTTNNHPQAQAVYSRPINLMSSPHQFYQQAECQKDFNDQDLFPFNNSVNEAQNQFIQKNDILMNNFQGVEMKRKRIESQDISSIQQKIQSNTKMDYYQKMQEVFNDRRQQELKQQTNLGIYDQYQHHTLKSGFFNENQNREILDQTPQLQQRNQKKTQIKSPQIISDQIRNFEEIKQSMKDLNAISSPKMKKNPESYIITPTSRAMMSQNHQSFIQNNQQIQDLLRNQINQNQISGKEINFMAERQRSPFLGNHLSDLTVYNTTYHSPNKANLMMGENISNSNDILGFKDLPSTNNKMRYSKHDNNQFNKHNSQVAQKDQIFSQRTIQMNTGNKIQIVPNDISIREHPESQQYTQQMFQQNKKNINIQAGEIQKFKNQQIIYAGRDNMLYGGQNIISEGVYILKGSENQLNQHGVDEEDLVQQQTPMALETSKLLPNLGSNLYNDYSASKANNSISSAASKIKKFSKDNKLQSAGIVNANYQNQLKNNEKKR